MSAKQTRHQGRDNMKRLNPNPPLTQELLKQHLKYWPVEGFWFRIRDGKKMGSPNNKGYLYIGINGRVYSAARLAFLYMLGQWPHGDVDHINRIKNDNRWVNLRECTHQENTHNGPMRKNNKSGFKGVSWNKQCSKWIARISMGQNQYIYLGAFDTAPAAGAAWNEYAINHRGKFHNP